MAKTKTQTICLCPGFTQLNDVIFFRFGVYNYISVFSFFLSLYLIFRVGGDLSRLPFRNEI
jgi:hypothetical protein